MFLLMCCKPPQLRHGLPKAHGQSRCAKGLHGELQFFCGFEKPAQHASFSGFPLRGSSYPKMDEQEYSLMAGTCFLEKPISERPVLNKKCSLLFSLLHLVLPNSYEPPNFSQEPLPPGAISWAVCFLQSLLHLLPNLAMFIRDIIAPHLPTV